MSRNTFDGTRVVRSKGRTQKPWKVVLPGGLVLYRFEEREKAIAKLADLRAHATDRVALARAEYERIRDDEAAFQRLGVEAEADPA